MAKRAYKWTWQARIKPETLEALRELAHSLGFRVTTPGKYEGTGSAPTLLDSLAAAYERDPAGVRLALKVLGVVAEPLEDDVRFTSETAAE